jgi:hypothetical protein
MNREGDLRSFSAEPRLQVAAAFSFFFLPWKTVSLPTPRGGDPLWPEGRRKARQDPSLLLLRRRRSCAFG